MLESETSSHDILKPHCTRTRWSVHTFPSCTYGTYDQPCTCLAFLQSDVGVSTLCMVFRAIIREAKKTRVKCAVDSSVSFHRTQLVLTNAVEQGSKAKLFATGRQTLMFWFTLVSSQWWSRYKYTLCTIHTRTFFAIHVQWMMLTCKHLLDFLDTCIEPKWSLNSIPLNSGFNAQD